MRRKRRSRGTWLPNLGTIFGDQDSSYSGKHFILDLPPTAEYIQAVVPIVTDYPAEVRNSGVDTGTALGYFIGNEYFLHRIVGKVHAFFRTQYSGTDPNAFWAGALVTAGFFVARANDDQSAGGSDVPIGSTSTDALRHYNPADVNVIREPWLWRRQWLLGDPAMASLVARGGISSTERTNVAQSLPSSTSGYGSVLDGPHLDAKTKRRVGNDDRLWFAISAVGLPLGSTASTGGQGNQHIEVFLDHRCFGSLRRARNRGTF